MALFARRRASYVHHRSARPALRSRRVGLIALGVLAVILAAAWVDGGEEPLRPIVQEVGEPGATP